MRPVYERYDSRSAYTRDQSEAPITLEDLVRRVGNIELAIAILAQGDGEEGQADDGGDPDVGTQPLQGAATVAGAVKQGISRTSVDEFLAEPPAG
jgi:hypothetical protein